MAMRVQVTQVVFLVLNTLRLTQPMVGDLKGQPAVTFNRVFVSPESLITTRKISV